MTSTPHKQAITAAHLGCAAAAGYAVLKTAWALGSTVGVTADPAAWETFLTQMGGRTVALWGTVLLASLAGAILLSMVQPWGRHVPRRVRASLAWLGFAIMAPVGLVRLGETIVGAVAGNPSPLLTPAIYVYVYTCFVVLGMTFAVTAWRTRTPRAASVSQPAARLKPPALRVLRIGGWANITIGAVHVVGLLSAWTMFRAVGVEEDMRELATQGAALPYVVTLFTAAAFLVFGLYALSGAGDLRRLPLLRAGLAFIAVVYVYRARWGIGALSEGDAAEVAFAVIALLIGLCYAYGAVARRRADTAPACTSTAASRRATAPADMTSAAAAGQPRPRVRRIAASRSACCGSLPSGA